MSSRAERLLNLTRGQTVVDVALLGLDDVWGSISPHWRYGHLVTPTPSPLAGPRFSETPSRIRGWGGQDGPPAVLTSTPPTTDEKNSGLWFVPSVSKLAELCQMLVEDWETIQW